MKKEEKNPSFYGKEERVENPYDISLDKKETRASKFLKRGKFSFKDYMLFHEILSRPHQ